jgi:hypothetical protein
VRALTIASAKTARRFHPIPPRKRVLTIIPQAVVYFGSVGKIWRTGFVPIFTLGFVVLRGFVIVNVSTLIRIDV